MALAVDILLDGGVVCIPTDTVYGLASCVDNELGINKVFDIKGREFSSPLPILLASEKELLKYSPLLNPTAKRLAHFFWPGALTIVLEKNVFICDSATGGLATAGFRVPADRAARTICQLVGGAVTGTSANKTGHPAATSASEALSQLGDSPLELILDGGSTLSNTASTVIDCTNDVPIILRHGAISVSSLEEVLGKEVKFNEGS